MPHIPKVVCGNCHREMKPVKNGAVLEGIKPDNQPYYKVQCDCYSCEVCGNTVYTSFAYGVVRTTDDGYNLLKSDAGFVFR